MDTQRSNPDQQSQSDRATPGGQQQEEGVGKDQEKRGSQQGGQQPARESEHKSREDKTANRTGRNRVPARSPLQGREPELHCGERKRDGTSA